ncbi:MAG: oligoendopeptidase F [Candidatus Faecousia sp.]|nr:oligoendopeptidase F [Clostridiales bacterium]MDD6297450.1 oligoendopeptidase F [Bacillota bacterium]MDD7340798.1 oligoendopeptidase F [Bacillota bacterium]MDY2809229.1 oligoendopeptidase F [Candidatus Faecousia sp.]
MSETKKLLTRADLAKADTWATEDLYATDALWEETLATLKADTAELASYAGKLSNADDLYAYLTKTEEVHVKLGRLGNYSSRKADEDTRNTVYQAMNGKFMSEAVALSAATSFETPELVALSDEQMEALYAACPGLERYRRYLTDARRRKAHILSPAEEKLLAAAGEMADTPDNIFGAFTNADMTFPDAVDGKGEAHPLSSGNFVLYEESADRELRKSAYENLYHTYAASKNTSAALLNGQAKVLKFNSDARKYPFSLDAALDATNVPTSVYYNLIEAVHQNLDKMHRYVRLRKKLLGVDELHFYDIYTPLVAGVDRHIPIDEAKKTVYDALYPLGEDYRKVLKSGFENRWIDVYPNVGKRSGAYSAGADIHPYVLLNYTGTLDNQFTLAHEMGHALHSYYSNKTQNPLDAGYKIFVAEVASTCNEALLMEYLLGKTTDRKERAYLINHFLDQFKGTLYRQTMFAEFELFMGKLAAEGKTLTADVLCAEYRRLNEMYYGPDMVVDDEIAMEWARIPHFYYNYYVFQYATGYSAAIALSRRILREGESAVKDYLGFLSGGCSKSPLDLLRGAGVDMESVEPVNQAIALFDSLLDEMEALVAE